MEPKSPLLQSQRLAGGLTIDDILQRILDQQKQKPQVERFAFFIHELATNHQEAFRQCFVSRSRVIRLIQESISEDYILVMLKYATADPQVLRPVIEKRFPQSYLQLTPEYMRMISTNVMAQRDQQAAQNINKIELIYETIVKRYNIGVSTLILVGWVALIPAELKANNHVAMLSDFLKQICLSTSLDLNILLDLVATELSGSGSFGIVIAKYSWSASTIADAIIQFSAAKKVEISRIFRVLSKNYKTVKFYEVAEDVVKRLNAQMQLSQLA